MAVGTGGLPAAGASQPPPGRCCPLRESAGADWEPARPLLSFPPCRPPAKHVLGQVAPAAPRGRAGGGAAGDGGIAAPGACVRPPARPRRLAHGLASPCLLAPPCCADFVGRRRGLIKALTVEVRQGAGCASAASRSACGATLLPRSAMCAPMHSMFTWRTPLLCL